MPKLDPRHVQVAADLLRLEPKTQIARKHNVSVQTLDRWIASPQFQALYQDLEARLSASRASHFAPLLVDVAGLLREVAQGHARRIRERGIDYTSPSIAEIRRLLRELAGLQRTANADALLSGRSIAGGPKPKGPEAAASTVAEDDLDAEARAESIWDQIRAHTEE